MLVERFRKNLSMLKSSNDINYKSSAWSDLYEHFLTQKINCYNAVRQD
jgi:hypothetical protein